MSGVSRFALLVSKFRGCLVGSLVGDCLGSLPEVSQVFTAAATATAGKVGGSGGRMIAAEEQHLDEAGALPFSAPTSNLRSVGESLLQCRQFDRTDMAQRLAHENAINNSFAQSSISSPNSLLDRKNEADVAALRTNPIAMFFYGDLAKAVEVARYSSGIHQRPNDFGMSAVLNCLAVHLALQFDPIRPLNVELFLDRLVSNVAEVEAVVERGNKQGTVVVDHDKHSLRQLESIRDMLRHRHNVNKAVSTLVGKETDGSSVSAAIYTFLQAQQQRDSETDNPLERVLHQSVSVSNTGDALPSLACGLAGAFHGIEAVPMSMRKRCRGLYDTVKLADRLALQFETQPGVYERAEMSLVQRL